MIRGFHRGRSGIMCVMDRRMEFWAEVHWCLFGGEGWAVSTAWDEAVWLQGVGSIMGTR